MGEPNILELAKQGHPDAIADLIARSLKPQGITSKAKLIGNCLYIFLESDSVYPSQSLVQSIRQGMRNLRVTSIKTVKVYGRQLGHKTAAWTQEFELNSQSNSTPLLPPAPNTKLNSISEPKKPAIKLRLPGLTRHLEWLFWVILTFVLTTLFWDKLGILKPLNYSGEFSQHFNAILGKINPKTATINGGAWVNKEGGSSDILRGLEIVLCPASVKPELIRIRDNKWRESQAKFKTTGGYWHLNLMAINAKVAANKNCFAPVRTGIEGKYIIPDVPFGNYFIYAPYETTFSKAYWMVPVEVKNTKPIQIDLDNSNMMELYNQE